MLADRAEDVFRPGAFPEYTYISRKSAVSDLPYEFRLMQAIKVSGFLTSLAGPSKMGKTILCEKVIGFEQIVEVSGADFDEDTDFWKLVSAKPGLHTKASLHLNSVFHRCIRCLRLKEVSKELCDKTAYFWHFLI